MACGVLRYESTEDLGYASICQRIGGGGDAYGPSRRAATECPACAADGCSRAAGDCQNRGCERPNAPAGHVGLVNGFYEFMAARFASIQPIDERHRHKTHAGALSHFCDAGGGLCWLRSDFNRLALWQSTRRASLDRGLGHSPILPRLPAGFAESGSQSEPRPTSAGIDLLKHILRALEVGWAKKWPEPGSAGLLGSGCFSSRRWHSGTWFGPG